MIIIVMLSVFMIIVAMQIVFMIILFMLSALMIIIVMLSALMIIIVMLSVAMIIVVMLSVIILKVFAPPKSAEELKTPTYSIVSIVFTLMHLLCAFCSDCKQRVCQLQGGY
jgi:hypothetical protein